MQQKIHCLHHITVCTCWWAHVKLAFVALLSGTCLGSRFQSFFQFWSGEYVLVNIRFLGLCAVVRFCFVCVSVFHLITTYLVTYALLSYWGAGICYPKYGCFSNDPPFDGRPLVDFPQHPTVIQTKFRLFTRASSSSDLIDDTDIHKLKASNYDGKKKTTFIIHGWLGRDILDIAQRVSLS